MSDKIEEFEQILKDLGYEDDAPVRPKEQKLLKQTNYMCSNGAIAIYLFFIPYFNKKSYLYLEYLDHLDSPDLKDKIKRLAEKIEFNTKTRLAEIGWEAKYNRKPETYTLEERKKIFFSFIKEAHHAAQNGFRSVNIRPEPNDIVVGKPQGAKLNEGLTESSIELGTKQRSLVAKRFGLGDLYEDGFQYGKYDENLNIIPI
jgi:hypothetical protein